MRPFQNLRRLLVKMGVKEAKWVDFNYIFKNVVDLNGTGLSYEGTYVRGYETGLSYEGTFIRESDTV